MHKFASPLPTGPKSHGIRVVSVTFTVSERPEQQPTAHPHDPPKWALVPVVNAQASYVHLDAAGRPLNPHTPSSHVVHGANDGTKAHEWAAALAQGHAELMALAEKDIAEDFAAKVSGL